MADHDVSNTNLTHAHNRVVVYLRRRINRGDFISNRKLPSRSELARQFEVSLPVVSAAFRELSNEGLMHVVPGKGAFALSNDLNRKRILNIGLIGWFASLSESYQVKHDQYWQTILNDLIAEAAKKGWSFTIIGNTSEEPLDLERISNFNPDLLISYGIHLSMKSVVKLRRRSIPLILGERYLEKAGVSYVSYDFAGNFRKVVRCFNAKGHRKIACLVPQMLIPEIIKQARQNFFMEMLDCGCQMDSTDLFRVHSLPKKQQTWQKLEEFGRDEMSELLKMPAPPTAIYCLCPEIARGAADAAEAEGIQIGKDISIICSAVDEAYTPFSSIIQQHKKLVDKLLETALKVVDSPYEPHQVLIPGKFVDKGSIADLTAKEGE